MEANNLDTPNIRRYSVTSGNAGVLEYPDGIGVSLEPCPDGVVAGWRSNDISYPDVADSLDRNVGFRDRVRVVYDHKLHHLRLPGIALSARLRRIDNPQLVRVERKSDTIVWMGQDQEWGDPARLDVIAGSLPEARLVLRKMGASDEIGMRLIELAQVLRTDVGQ